jgi:thiol-disulfide isomerase/thioredoxin
MVEFMTTWCGHCRQFAPHYAATATELKKDGIPCAKVNMDDVKTIHLQANIVSQFSPQRTSSSVCMTPTRAIPSAPRSLGRIRVTVPKKRKKSSCTCAT